jgi:hypothetical protein
MSPLVRETAQLSNVSQVICHAEKRDLRLHIGDFAFPAGGDRLPELSDDELGVLLHNATIPPRGCRGGETNRTGAVIELLVARAGTSEGITPDNAEGLFWNEEAGLLIGIDRGPPA